jgi:hypothetical protein
MRGVGSSGFDDTDSSACCLFGESTVSVNLGFLPVNISGWRQINVAAVPRSYRPVRCSGREEGAGDKFHDLSEWCCWSWEISA